MTFTYAGLGKILEWYYSIRGIHGIILTSQEGSLHPLKNSPGDTTFKPRSVMSTNVLVDILLNQNNYDSCKELRGLVGPMIMGAG